MEHKHFTEQDVRDFYEDFHQLKDGCYSIHVPTWNSMWKQHPTLCGWCCGTLFWTLIFVVYGG